MRRQGPGRRHTLGWALPAAALLAATVLAAPAPLAAQEAASDDAVISVSGYGFVELPPDTARLSVGVRMVEPTLADAADEVNRQATDIVNAIKAEGIAARDIQTSSYTVSIVRDRTEGGDPNRVVGYEVSNQVNVVIRDVDAVSALLDAAITAGANEIRQLQFYVEDLEPHRLEAHALAIEDATKKAARMAEAAGLELGPVVAISDGTIVVPTQVYVGAQAGGRGGGGGAPIESGTVSVSANAVMTFELEEAGG